MEMSFRVKTVIFSTLVVVARGLVPLDLHPRLIFLFSNVFLHSDRVLGVFRFAFRNAFSRFLFHVFNFMFYVCVRFGNEGMKGRLCLEIVTKIRLHAEMRQIFEILGLVCVCRSSINCKIYH